MASLEDVKRYARQHADRDHGELAAEIAREFGMSREEAARLLGNLGEEGSNREGDSLKDRTDEVLPVRPI